MDQTIVFTLCVAALLGFLVFKLVFGSREKPLLRSVAILVLGDVGRSPRMMYHAESFATNEFETYIIGNKGQSCARCSVLSWSLTEALQELHPSHRCYPSPASDSSISLTLQNLSPASHSCLQHLEKSSCKYFGSSRHYLYVFLIHRSL